VRLVWAAIEAQVKELSVVPGKALSRRVIVWEWFSEVVRGGVYVGEDG
jgi:hypothetical protein